MSAWFLDSELSTCSCYNQSSIVSQLYSIYNCLWSDVHVHCSKKGIIFYCLYVLALLTYFNNIIICCSSLKGFSIEAQKTLKCLTQHSYPCMHAYIYICLYACICRFVCIYVRTSYFFILKRCIIGSWLPHTMCVMQYHISGESRIL